LFHSRSGSSLVEFSLVFPLLTLLFAGAMQVAFLAFRQLVLERAASVSERAASLSGLATSGEIEPLIEAKVGHGIHARVAVRSLPSRGPALFERARTAQAIDIILDQPAPFLFPIAGSIWPAPPRLFARRTGFRVVDNE
jgi:hypothetical protein